MVSSQDRPPDLLFFLKIIIGTVVYFGALWYFLIKGILMNFGYATFSNSAIYWMEPSFIFYNIRLPVYLAITSTTIFSFFLSRVYKCKFHWPVIIVLSFWALALLLGRFWVLFIFAAL